MQNIQTLKQSLRALIVCIALRPKYLQYIEMVEVLQKIEYLKNNYEDEMDQTSILKIHQLWIECGGKSNLFILSEKFVNVIAQKWDMLHLSKQVILDKKFHFKSKSNQITRPTTTCHTERLNGGKQNVDNGNKKFKKPNYVKRRVDKIFKDFQRIAKRPLASK